MSSQRRNYRFILVVTLFVLASLAVSGRLVYLQVHDHEFLADQGDLRSIRDLPIPVTRGMITDRNGEPLAVSTEVASIWCNPREMAAHLDEVPRLAGALHRPRRRCWPRPRPTRTSASSTSSAACRRSRPAR